MRSSQKGGLCTYGLNNQAGYLFERNQETLRQRNIGRARGITGTPLKRTRDRDSDSDEDTHRYPRSRPERRVVLDGLKRMRVSSPTESESLNSDVDLDMTDEEAVTPRTTWRANKALVPVTSNKKSLQFTTPSAAQNWKMMHQQVSGQSMDIPNDDSCRVMVVFNPSKSISLSPHPRIQLVEDRELDTATSSESEDDRSVRFEELSSDNDEPVDMDID
ncbi:unnamed protein product [Peronospora farinosa]|uniref:Uncharacterized protein n=1 Tax=Peronospora farinosa TaxID=134698 RepID=A0AAV0TEG6_9STRA|nr:unnamed protein product [Peronospora farinosa]CAI5720062.1 unnamed protein product [Peronospora farinosa]